MSQTEHAHKFQKRSTLLPGRANEERFVAVANLPQMLRGSANWETLRKNLKSIDVSSFALALTLGLVSSNSTILLKVLDCSIAPICVTEFTRNE